MSEADKIGEEWIGERKGQYESGGRKTTDDLIKEQTAVLNEIRGHTGRKRIASVKNELKSPTGRVKLKAVGVLRCSECVEIDENDPPSA